jgi:hypothetical protein
MSAWSSKYKSHQGNLGLGQAIAFYTTRMIPIMLPLNDTQKYDLVIDDNGLKRVSVKTTQLRVKSGYFRVELKNSGGSSGKSVIRQFDNSVCDIIFIYTIDGDIYEIPSSEIVVKNQLTLDERFSKYRAGMV